jgi:hypothetical protein
MYSSACVHGQCRVSKNAGLPTKARLLSSYTDMRANVSRNLAHVDLKENYYTSCNMHAEMLNWQNCLLLDADKPPHAHILICILCCT